MQKKSLISFNADELSLCEVSVGLPLSTNHTVIADTIFIGKVLQLMAQV